MTLGVPYVKKMIVIMSGKGGVGKSTITVQLGKELTQKGFHVGLLDADIHGPSIAHIGGQQILGVELNPDTKKMKPGSFFFDPAKTLQAVYMSFGLMIQPGASIALRGPIISGMLKQMLYQVDWGSADRCLDFLLIDMPPGLGDIHLSLFSAITPDHVILISTSDQLSLADVRRTVATLEKLGVCMTGVLENMAYFSCPHCDCTSFIFDQGQVCLFAQEKNIPFLGCVPFNKKMLSDTRNVYLEDVCEKIIGKAVDEGMENGI